LIKILKTKKNELRKLFGERELKIIEKQLLGVRLTQSEKNRLSRDIRKKLEVVKILSEFEDEFGLKKSDENNKVISLVKKIILEDELAKNIKRIVMFGSTAEKENSLLSDLDIAVEFDSIDDKESTRFRLRNIGKINERVDLQVYNVLPEKIKKEIDKYGRIVYIKK
jgi:predicted nucleotidyltransferase